MTDYEREEIKTVVKTAVLEAFRDNPLCKDHETRIRDGEEWRFRRNGQIQTDDKTAVTKNNWILNLTMVVTTAILTALATKLI